MTVWNYFLAECACMYSTYRWDVSELLSRLEVKLSPN